MLLLIAYGIYTITLAVGLGLFFVYDWRHKFLPKKLLALHVGLAVATFITFSSALSLYTWHRPSPVYRQQQPLTNFHRQQQLRNRYPTHPSP